MGFFDDMFNVMFLGVPNAIKNSDNDGGITGAIRNAENSQKTKLDDLRKKVTGSGIDATSQKELLAAFDIFNSESPGAMVGGKKVVPIGGAWQWQDRFDQLQSRVDDAIGMTDPIFRTRDYLAQSEKRKRDMPGQSQIMGGGMGGAGGKGINLMTGPTTPLGSTLLTRGAR